MTNETPDTRWRQVRSARRSAPTEQPIALVVDPDPETRLLVEYALRHECTVDVATTAVGAVRMASETMYDAFFVNLALPGATGLVVLKRLRFRPAYRSAPIIAVTDHLLPGDRERTLNDGFDACMSKPLQEETVRARVTTLLSETPEPSPLKQAS